MKAKEVSVKMKLVLFSLMLLASLLAHGFSLVGTHHATNIKS